MHSFELLNFLGHYHFIPRMRSPLMMSASLSHTLHKWGGEESSNGQIEKSDLIHVRNLCSMSGIAKH